MTASTQASALDVAARDWKSWLSARGLDDAGAMTAYPVADLVATVATGLVGTRVYCAITAQGIPDYVGQTSRPLARRIAEHVRSGNGHEWAWVVSVSIEGLTGPQVDSLERSAHLWMVPLSRRRSRKTPAAY
jgi:hypothetical protein